MSFYPDSLDVRPELNRLATVINTARDDLKFGMRRGGNVGKRNVVSQPFADLIRRLRKGIRASQTALLCKNRNCQREEEDD